MSPHLTIWRWGRMLVSILHRVTGAGLTVVGLAVLTWWLMALADGPEAYADFAAWPAGSGMVVLVGLTWAFFQHTAVRASATSSWTRRGLRASANKILAILTIVGSVLLTAALWAYILGVRP